MDRIAVESVFVKGGLVPFVMSTALKREFRLHDHAVLATVMNAGSFFCVCQLIMNPTRLLWVSEWVCGFSSVLLCVWCVHSLYSNATGFPCIPFTLLPWLVGIVGCVLVWWAFPTWSLFKTLLLVLLSSFPLKTLSLIGGG